MFDIENLYMSKRISDTCCINKQFAQDIENSVVAFALDDWGITCSADWEMNTIATITNDQIVAKYHTCLDDIFIITDSGGEVTTVLFCNEN